LGGGAGKVGLERLEALLRSSSPSPSAAAAAAPGRDARLAHYGLALGGLGGVGLAGAWDPVGAGGCVVGVAALRRERGEELLDGVELGLLLEDGVFTLLLLFVGGRVEEVGLGHAVRVPVEPVAVLEDGRGGALAGVALA